MNLVLTHHILHTNTRHARLLNADGTRLVVIVRLHADPWLLLTQIHIQIRPPSLPPLHDPVESTATTAADTQDRNNNHSHSGNYSNTKKSVTRQTKTTIIPVNTLSITADLEGITAIITKAVI